MVLLAALLAAPPLPAQVREAFPRASIVRRRVLALTPARLEALRKRMGSDPPPLPRLLRFWEARQEARVLGWSLPLDIVGRSRPISFLVHLEAGGAVRALDVLAFRETHGGQVRRPGFLAQFRGKDARDPPRLGRNIRNVAGATLSCRAAVLAVRTALALLPLLPAEGSPGKEARPIRPRGTAGPVSRSRVIMGTPMEVVLPKGDPDAAVAALAEAARWDRLLSTYKPDSEIARLNRAPPGERRISPETFEALREARRWAERSGGLVDPTAGAITLLWREARREGTPPSESALRRALSLVGYRRLRLRASPPGVTVPPGGLRLDLGATAKGLALDRAAAVLRSRGVRSFLLNLGGQVLVQASPETPFAASLRHLPRRPPVRLVTGSLATTGDGQRGFRLGGRTFSHVMDPRTGHPLPPRDPVTVWGATALEADAVSTWLYLAGDEGPALAERRGWPALFTSGGKERPSTAWKERFP